MALTIVSPTLVCVRQSGTEAKAHNQESIRELSTEEMAAVSDATAFLKRFVDETPLRDVVAASDDLVTCIERLNSKWAEEPGGLQGHLREVHRALGAWLSCVKSFDDRIAHQLSQEYGRTSDELAQFREALSAEWDGVLEYRLATQLRNASDHGGNVINT